MGLQKCNQKSTQVDKSIIKSLTYRNIKINFLFVLGNQVKFNFLRSKLNNRTTDIAKILGFCNIIANIFRLEDFFGRTEGSFFNASISQYICKRNTVFPKETKTGKNNRLATQIFYLTILSPIWLGTYEYMKSSLENFFFGLKQGFQSGFFRFGQKFSNLTQFLCT